MSDLIQIHAALTRLFQEENRRIVFWNDPEGEFDEMLPSIALEGVTVLRLDQIGSLAAKIRLEREEPEVKFLLYSQKEEPEYEQDWLLDMRLYSRNFRADRASILLQQLGLTSLSLRPHLAMRRKFFDRKDRLQKLHAIAAPDDVEADLDRKMIAVVTKSEQPDLFVILRTVLHAWIDAGGEIDLEVPPSAWLQVEKFELDDAFWQMARASFSYDDDNPSLKNLLLRLFVTDLAHYLKGEIPPGLRQLLLPRSGWSNAVVCLAQWRDSSSKGTSYDRLSAEVAGVIKLKDHLASVDSSQLLDVMTFLEAEKLVASGLRDLVRSTKDTINPDEIRTIATRRRSGHWANDAAGTTIDAPREELHGVYDALVAASDFFSLKHSHRAGFDCADAQSLYQAYESELFRFDQLYRLFCESADQAEKNNWDILKPLRADIEQAYVNWYLPSLAMSWGKLVDPPDGLLSKWQMPEVRNQYDFFRRSVKPWIDEGENRRAFVIISDAFRYEAAHELASELNGKYRFHAELNSQLGVLPSYTTLGMASLLPHSTITYKPDGDVLVDGKPTSSTPDRDAVLKRVEGIAVQGNDLIGMKKEDGRDLIKDKRVVYIYHNTVDAIGDKAGSEHKTFEAVRLAINEVAALVGYVVNSLNGHHIVVTADHGFLFTESPPGETEKSKPTIRPEGAVKEKKRYVLGRNLPVTDAAWTGHTKVTAMADGDMDFWIPKGVNRFHFSGGARFVHGGAMPQEIVVPVLTVRQVRGKSLQETKTKLVSVQVLGSNHRITTGRHRFQLIQMDAVSDRVKAVTLRIGIYEGDSPVTNIETVTFDSASESMEDRKKWVNLVLQERPPERPYSKKTPYRLVLHDTDKVEQQSVEVVIDRAFTDDF